MHIILGDITCMDTDAIVNAASSDLKCYPGICEAIFNAGDTDRIEQACRNIGHCPIGHAVVTTAYGLPSKYIIHVAGPGYFSGTKVELLLLQRCYKSALHKAVILNCKSVAVPLMFSGAYHVPRTTALSIACSTISEFERENPYVEIFLVLYTKGIYELSKRILSKSNL